MFLLHGELGVQTDPARNHVYLQRLDSGTWNTVTSTPSVDANGPYSFKWRISTATSFRVTAYTTSGPKALSATRYVRVVPQSVAASIERVCDSNHDCVSQAKATGQVSPVREGRRVVLQYRSGSSWASHSATAYTDEHGKFETPAFSIAGWSQWSAKQLRIAAASYTGSTYAVSPLISFMPGPTQLGDNVLRVDVAGGAFPQTKGVDYTGSATLIKNGIREIDGARLDKFGVRGSASSTYPKKPYNLRFATPPTVPVFGMGTDRSWTLLAMYVDQSFVRDKTALDMGRKLSGMTWNPDSEYVELFVNSEYKGAYLMVEKVRIDGDKVNVDKDTGMIMETDMPTVSDSTKGLQNVSGWLGLRLQGAGQLWRLGGHHVAEAVGHLEEACGGGVVPLRQRVAARTTTNTIDRDSAADFHLAQEFFKDIDADFWRSKYFSWDMVNGSCGNELCDGRLHFGPVWDFGQSVGNVDATNPSMAYIRSYRGWAANGTGSGQPRDVPHPLVRPVVEGPGVPQLSGLSLE